MFRTYGKSIVAVLFALLTAAASALTDGVITAPEGVQVAIAAATAVGVYLVPVMYEWPWAKTAIAMLLAGLNLAVTIITNGITPAEWINLGVAALSVLAVAKAPAESTV